MELSDIFHQFFNNLKNTGIAEYIAVFTGLLSVWYARKENILVYPIGIISVILYVYLCYHAGLYADMGINAFYFVTSIYGWYKWTRRDKISHQHRPIAWCNKKETAGGILAIIVFTLIIYQVLYRFTDSTVPFIDALTTAIFIVGMWLMALKKIENWIYWIIGDTVCVFLFPYKGLYFSSVQYVVFLILAIFGYIEWKRRWKAVQVKL